MDNLSQPRTAKVSADVTPAFRQQVEEQAAYYDVPVAEVVRNMLEYALSEGWTYKPGTNQPVRHYRATKPIDFDESKVDQAAVEEHIVSLCDGALFYAKHPNGWAVPVVLKAQALYKELTFKKRQRKASAHIHRLIQEIATTAHGRQALEQAGIDYTVHTRKGA